MGEVYRNLERMDRLVPNFLQASKLYVRLDGKDYEVFYLMVEAFNLKIGPTDRIKYKIIRSKLLLPLQSIRIIPIAGREFFNSDEEYKMNFWNCPSKAGHSNARFADKITAYELYEALKNDSFKCHYCGNELTPEKWQIDHFNPKFLNGKNVFGNIVASCERCNRMKNTMGGQHFLATCCKIANKVKRSKYKFENKIDVKSLNNGLTG